MSSGKELKKPKRVEVDANELDELVEKEKGSTSLEPEERREEVEKPISEMTLWGDVHEELQSEKIPYINLKVDESILALNKNEKATIVEKEHATFEDLVKIPITIPYSNIIFSYPSQTVRVPESAHQLALSYIVNHIEHINLLC